METKNQEEKKYPGAGFTGSKNEEVNACLKKQYTRELNNNPRNQGKIV